MPVRLACSLFSMRKNTESFYSFQVEREQEIFKEYVNGMESEVLTFKTDEDKEKFVKEMTDLTQMEVDAEPVHIPLSMKLAHKKHATLNQPNKKKGLSPLLFFLFFFYKIFNPN